MYQGKRMETKNILQRDMDLPKFMYLLQRKVLFLPKMSVFDDQLEGGLTAKDYLSTSNDAAIFDNAINGFWSPASETVDERLIRLEKAKSTHIEIRQREFKTPFGTYKCEDIDKVFPRLENGFMLVVGTNLCTNVLLCGRCMEVTIIQFVSLLLKRS